MILTVAFEAQQSCRAALHKAGLPPRHPAPINALPPGTAASPLVRSAPSARSNRHLLRKSQQFQGKQLPAKSSNGKRENESLVCVGRGCRCLLLWPSSVSPQQHWGAAGAGHSCPSLQCGVRCQGHKQPGKAWSQEISRHLLSQAIRNCF